MKRKNNKAKNNIPERTEGKRRTNPFVAFICIFLSLTVVFGATLITITLVRQQRAAAMYEGVTMDQKVASYFASEAKKMYLAKVSGTPHAGDTPVFWRMTAEDGRTHGENLEDEVRYYISEILVANYLFERYAEYTASDKAAVDKAVNEILADRADGDVAKFNELVKDSGYDFNSFKVAAMMSYKTAAAKAAIYGTEGKNIASESALCEEYLATYTHVYMFFIGTKNKDVYDENGNYVDTLPLSSTEKAERLAEIEAIRGYISATGEITMSPALFKSEGARLDDFNKNMHTNGYYFNPASPYTTGITGKNGGEFADVAEELRISALLDMAYEMKVGEYGELVVDSGVWFIYTEDVLPGAYTLSALEDCFYDFYNDAATYSYLKTLAELSVDVQFSEIFEKIDLVNISKMGWNSPSFN